MPAVEISLPEQILDSNLEERFPIALRVFHPMNILIIIVEIAQNGAVKSLKKFRVPICSFKPEVKSMCKID